MRQPVRLWRDGDSIAVTLPKHMVGTSGLEAGDTVIAIETDCGILLVPCDPDTEEARFIVCSVAGAYRNALRRLAD